MADRANAKSKVLIIGGNAALGANLMKMLASETTQATYYRNCPPGGIPFDVGSQNIANCVANLGEYSHALLLPAAPSIDACKLEENRWRHIMVDGIKRTAGRLMDAGVIPVFTSSDYVFDGNRGGYSEHDEPSAIGCYGQFKAEFENYLRADGRPQLTIRLSKVLASVRDTRELLFNWCVEIEAGNDIRCAIDHYFCPIDAEDAVRMIVHLIQERASGLFNVCGSERVNHLQLMTHLSRALGEYGKQQPRPGQVRECSINDLGLLEIRPHDISMQSRKSVEATGITPKSLDATCRRFLKWN